MIVRARQRQRDEEGGKRQQWAKREEDRGKVGEGDGEGAPRVRAQTGSILSSGANP